MNWYVYDSVTFMYLKTIISNEKPLNSTDKSLNIEVSKAKWNGEDWIVSNNEKEPVPTEVALWKLRFVLSQMQLEQSVTDAINLLEEPQRTAATYIWNFGTAVDRYSNTVIFIKTALGFTEQEVDDIFIKANSIQL